MPAASSPSAPAHDLSDYWRCGKNLRVWIAEQVAVHRKILIASLDQFDELHINHKKTTRLLIAIFPE